MPWLVFQVSLTLSSPSDNEPLGGPDQREFSNLPASLSLLSLQALTYTWVGVPPLPNMPAPWLS